MFRYDRPQAGRYREFHQFGVEVLGASSPAADAEVINLAYTLFKTLGLKELELHINSIGDYKCRPIYRQKLIEFFEEKKTPGPFFDHPTALSVKPMSFAFPPALL